MDKKIVVTFLSNYFLQLHLNSASSRHSKIINKSEVEWYYSLRISYLIVNKKERQIASLFLYSK